MTNNFSIAVSNRNLLLVLLCLFVAQNVLPKSAYASEAESAWSVADDKDVDVPDQNPVEPAQDAVETTTDLKEDNALQEALQASKPKVASRTATIRNRQLAQDLKAQFKAIVELLKRKDPFNPEVGELYFSYATLLLQAAEFEKQGMLLPTPCMWKK